MPAFDDETFSDEAFGDETFGEEVCDRVSGENVESLLGQFVYFVFCRMLLMSNLSTLPLSL